MQTGIATNLNARWFLAQQTIERDLMNGMTIDGFGPLPVTRPDSVGELGELVRRATTDRPLYPIGGRTQIGLGRTPSKIGAALDLGGLDRVIEFPARDMTITVQAGITLAKLQQTLAPENLRLPIDVPLGSAATLGGTLAANISGHRRFGYGTLRDYVIGISAVNDEGSEFKAGGRVVKNVAGYDLCKLLVGSMGTLGIITQVTLKLRPLAEEQAILCVPCGGEQLRSLLDQLLASRTRPVMLDVFNRFGGKLLFPQATQPSAVSEFVVLIGYEGNGDAVKWQMQHLVKELGATFPIEARVGFTSKPLDDAMTEWNAWPDATLTLKASMLSSAVPEFLRTVQGFGSEPRLRAHAGNGIVVGHYARDLSSEMARRVVNAWRTAAVAVVMMKCPAEWKPDLDVWGSLPQDIDAMRQVQDRFDPRRIFNPNRFIV